ncbi:MAG: ankyrin repeat domain-containing protein [Acidobacteria bacterium]|nr:ankyrin repeat domain-containing protein [Acidobacteriota bacterium]
MTPAQELHEAIRVGDEARVNALLDADPSLVHGGGASGMAPLLLAIYTKRPLMAKLLLGRGAELDVFAAAAMGETAKCRKFVQADDVLLQMASADGWTPLHLACFFGHPETAEMLLAMGADANVRSANAMHNTPLHAAAAGRGQDCCALLLSHGADVNATQQAQYTALHAAAANGDLEIVRLLLAHEANPAAKSEKGETAIEMARQRGHAAVADLLERTSR